MKKPQYRRNLLISLSLGIAAAALVAAWILLDLGSWLVRFSDREALEAFVSSFGWMAPLVFLVIQIIQVIAAPIPGAVTGMVSGYLFGAFWGSVITQLGITVGSLIAFSLARRFGRPLVERFVNRTTLTKLDEIVQKRGISGLFIMFLLPFLPDDAICFVAGLSAIRLRYFLFLVLVARTPSSVVSSLTGAGLIVISPGGWAVVALFSVAAAFLVFRYEKDIRDWLWKQF